MTDTTIGVAPFVRRSRDARGVVTLVLDRPQSFNALSEGMLAALQAELDALSWTTRPGRRHRGRARRSARSRPEEMRAEPSPPYYETLFAQCARMMLALQRLPCPLSRASGIATRPAASSSRPAISRRGQRRALASAA